VIFKVIVIHYIGFDIEKSLEVKSDFPSHLKISRMVCMC